MNEGKRKTNLIKRKSIRLQGYDYSQPGGYFVTMCTHKKIMLFGHIKNEKMILNPSGTVARGEWLQIKRIFPIVEIYEEEYIIMPNHIHGIVWIRDGGATETVVRRTTSGPKKNSLGAIIGQYKSRVTKRIRHQMNNQGKPIWQRGYYDRIIRSDKDLRSIRRYIELNPFKWANSKDKTLPELF
jgi:putative transposase